MVLINYFMFKIIVVSIAIIIISQDSTNLLLNFMVDFKVIVQLLFILEDFEIITTMLTNLVEHFRAIKVFTLNFLIKFVNYFLKVVKC